MQSEIKFKFSLEDRVRSRHTPPITGQVRALELDADGIQWALVEYTTQASGLRTDWLRERELELST